VFIIVLKRIFPQGKKGARLRGERWELSSGEEEKRGREKTHPLRSFPAERGKMGDRERESECSAGHGRGRKEKLLFVGRKGEGERGDRVQEKGGPVNSPPST